VSSSDCIQDEANWINFFKSWRPADMEGRLGFVFCERPA